MYLKKILIVIKLFALHDKKSISYCIQVLFQVFCSNYNITKTSFNFFMSSLDVVLSKKNFRLYNF